jgi:hypothetical protein
MVRSYIQSTRLVTFYLCATNTVTPRACYVWVDFFFGWCTIRSSCFKRFYLTGHTHTTTLHASFIHEPLGKNRMMYPWDSCASLVPHNFFFGCWYGQYYLPHLQTTHLVTKIWWKLLDGLNRPKYLAADKVSACLWQDAVLCYTVWQNNLIHRQKIIRVRQSTT